MKKGIVNFLGAIAGKEVSKELINEFQDEFDDIIKILKSSNGFENIPNLELESFEIKIDNANQVIQKDFKTKIEHKRVLGVFLTHRVPTGGTTLNRNSKISIQVDRKFICSQGLFYFPLIEKTEELTIYETAWRTNIEISTSDVKIEYHDGGNITPPYNVNVYFICEK